MKLGLLLKVERSQIYEDMLNEYILDKFPLQIKFSGEIAYDTGGVYRDNIMFSAFLDEAYKTFFDGSCLLTFTLRPHVDM